MWVDFSGPIVAQRTAGSSRKRGVPARQGEPLGGVGSGRSRFSWPAMLIPRERPLTAWGHDTRQRGYLSRFRLIGVGADALVDGETADLPTLFDRPRQLAEAIAAVRQRHGAQAVQRGRTAGSGTGRSR